MEKPAFSVGSLTNTSEGVSQAGLMSLASMVVLGDFSDSVKMAAIVAVAIGSGLYAISRGMSKGKTDAK
ncbi:MAG: hypothetical protein Unbinned5784contig1000_23 [Prokaryotic dsDNA virus sp.]|nr:MAG: hypothetical protein Unbinned5784contig1000_23 [Prokaryotic dsDNA virus sp.]